MTAAEKQKPVPPYSPRDETELLWYFGPGQAAFSRSQMGGMLDHAANRKTGQYPREAVLNSAGAIIGWASGLTARPTAETRTVSGYTPDEYVVVKFSLMSRGVLRVERADRQAASVIASFFGELGNRWSLKASENTYGRYGSLFHLTKKGQALVESGERAPNSLAMTPQLRLETLAIANKVKPTEERTAQLTVCAVQAERLEQEARAVWHAVNARLRERSSSELAT